MSSSLSLFCSSKTRFSPVVDTEAGFSGVAFRCSMDSIFVQWISMDSIGRAFYQGHDEAYPMHRRSWQQAEHFRDLEDMQRTDMQTPRDLQEMIKLMMVLYFNSQKIPVR